MKIEDMSNEEFVKEFINYSITYMGNPQYVGIDINTIKAAHLSRLELGRMAIEIVDELHASFTIETPQHLIDMVIDFAKQREGVK
jgi:hypothetical protein